MRTRAPCGSQTAGARQGLPGRVRAPQRGRSPFVICLRREIRQVGERLDLHAVVDREPLFPVAAEASGRPLPSKAREKEHTLFR